MSLARALELRAKCDYRGALDALAAAETRDELVARSQLREDFADDVLARADAVSARDAVRGSQGSRSRSDAPGRRSRSSPNCWPTRRGASRTRSRTRGGASSFDVASPGPSTSRRRRTR